VYDTSIHITSGFSLDRQETQMSQRNAIYAIGAIVLVVLLVIFATN